MHKRHKKTPACFIFTFVTFVHLSFLPAAYAPICLRALRRHLRRAVAACAAAPAIPPIPSTGTTRNQHQGTLLLEAFINIHRPQVERGRIGANTVRASSKR